ncbi:MAG: hypothetical protein V6004_01910 [Candidatus Dasytiphilus stammeri]
MCYFSFGTWNRITTSKAQKINKQFDNRSSSFSGILVVVLVRKLLLIN